LAKVVQTSGGFLTNSLKIDFLLQKSPDLLNENSSGRLILKHPQTKPFVAFQWGPNWLVLIEKPVPAVGI